MTRRHPPQFRLPVWTPLALLACLSTASAANADRPALAIRLTEGESTVYPVDGIENVLFEGDSVIVVTAGGTKSYLAEKIERIDYLRDTGSTRPGEATAQLHNAIHLFQNQRNPFSSLMEITFDLPQTVAGRVMIYSPGGELVRTLLTGVHSVVRQPVHWDGVDDNGRQSVCWGGLDNRGRRAPAGVYFFAVIAPGVEETRRMILLPNAQLRQVDTRPVHLLGRYMLETLSPSVNGMLVPNTRVMGSATRTRHRR